MKKRKNLYAVYFIKRQERKIFYNWQECQKAMKGQDNLFKGFMNEQEAEEWFSSITENKIEAHHHKVKQKRDEQELKSRSKKYEVYLDQKHSEALECFLKRHKITITDYIKETIELDLMNEED